MSNSKDAAIAAVIKHNESCSEYWNNEEYTKSIVAFIDVMGVSDLLLTDSEDFNAHKAIYQALSRISGKYSLDEYRKYFTELYGEFGVKSTVMSDSIVLSVNVNVPNALAKMSMFMSEYLSELLLLNAPFFARGAITVGNIYHEDNIVFGPALAKAVDMEKNNAVNFRCIVDKNEFNELYDTENDDFKNIVEAYFYPEGDYYCFDYFYRFLGFADNKVISGDNNATLFLNALGKIQRKVRDEIRNNKNKHIKSKYKYMEKYYNRTLTRVLDNSETDEYIWLKNAREEWRAKR